MGLHDGWHLYVNRIETLNICIVPLVYLLHYESSKHRAPLKMIWGRKLVIRYTFHIPAFNEPRSVKSFNLFSYSCVWLRNQSGLYMKYDVLIFFWQFNTCGIYEKCLEEMLKIVSSESHAHWTSCLILLAVIKGPWHVSLSKHKEL